MNKKIWELDGIRGIAILSVIAFHGLQFPGTSIASDTINIFIAKKIILSKKVRRMYMSFLRCQAIYRRSTSFFVDGAGLPHRPPALSPANLT